jgi:membrane protein DedA with SNARE-associated domain
MSSAKLAILCVTGVAFFGLAILAYHAAVQAGSAPSFVAVAAFVTVGAVLISGLRYLTARRQSHHQLTDGEQYRALAEEYRRLSDLAITAQEHTDLKMGEVNAQLDYLRTQNESLQKILRDVE